MKLNGTQLGEAICEHNKPHKTDWFGSAIVKEKLKNKIVLIRNEYKKLTVV